MRGWGKWVGIVLVAVVVAAVAADLMRGRVTTGSPSGEHPDFVAKDLQGRDWKLAEHRGKGPLIVNFFATWCGPCAQEVPHLIRWQKEFRDRGLRVVIMTQEPAADIRRIRGLATAPVTLLTDAEHVFKAYGVESIPYTVYFAPDGTTQVIEGLDQQAMRGLEEQFRAMPARSASAR